MPHARVIFVVHSMRGRLRCRLSWLRGRTEDATAVADALAAMPGMGSVEVRPYTGSVLCQYDPSALDERRILDAITRHTGVSLVNRPGERCLEVEREIERAVREARREGADLARSVAAAFRGISTDVLRATEGRLDLGTLMALGFVTGGALEVVATRKLPMPPWFQLGWWAFRAFTTLEQKAIQHVAETTPERPSLA